MFGLNKRSFVSFACLLALMCPQMATAGDSIVRFSPLSGPDVDMVRQILVSDTSLTDLLVEDHIRIPEDIQIARTDLNNDGKQEIMLFIKLADHKSCAQEDCRFQVWQQRDDHWEKIGAYMMKEEPLHVYDKTQNGYRELANSQGVINWNE